MAMPSMPLHPDLIGRGNFSAPSSIPPVVNAAMASAATQFDIRPGTGGGGIVRNGDMSGVHDPRNHVGSQLRLTEVRHTVPVRRSTRGYEKGLLQYTPMMILRRNGDPQEHAQIVSLPYANWILQQTQVTDKTFWHTYGLGQKQQQELRTRTASWALMQIPDAHKDGEGPPLTEEVEVRRKKFLQNAGSIDSRLNADGECIGDWCTYSQSWGGALSTFVPFMGVVNVVSGNEQGISQSITPRCSFFAAGRAPIHQMWGTNKEGTMLYFAIVPYDRLRCDEVDLTGGCSVDASVPSIKDMRFGASLEEEMHTEPYLKIPAWRNPDWTPDLDPLLEEKHNNSHHRKIYPVCFLPAHRDVIHRAVLRRNDALVKEWGEKIKDSIDVVGPAEGGESPHIGKFPDLLLSRDQALDDFYATIALEYVGMLVQAPERMPSSEDQRRAPFDLTAMRRLPTAFVSLEITNSV